MIATDNSNTGGTADIESGEFVTYDAVDIADFIDAFDSAERAAWIRYCRMQLFERLGAVLTHSGGSVRYWQVYSLKKVLLPQRARLQRLGFFAGFMSESRGLHWDRKR